MAFQWDAGNIDHIALHGISIDEAEQVLENNPMELRKEERNGEQRVLHLGETNAGRVLLVAVTVRGDKVRVVTAYPAKRKIRTFYSKQKGTSNGKYPQDP